MIKNYKELQSVRQELKQRLDETESMYAHRHVWIGFFLDITGIHKGKSNSEARKEMHAHVVQGISTYLEGHKWFSRFNKEVRHILIPVAVTALSIYLLKR